jgi:peroxiredoxin
MAPGTGPAVAVDPTLTVGDLVPDFTLNDQHGVPVTLSALCAQRPVLVVFFPFAFSGICTGELTEVRDDLGSFDNDAVQVVTVSCDPMYALRAWADREAYFFPLLSDFWPHGEVARSFGVLHQKGFAVRGSFLIDGDRRLRWSQVNGPADRRDFDAARTAIAALATS